MNPNPDPVDTELYGFAGSGSGIFFLGILEALKVFFFTYTYIL